MLLDAHAHLDFYQDTLDPALDQINANRIFTISTAMDLPSYRRNLEITQRSEFVLSCLGVHPRNALGNSRCYSSACGNQKNDNTGNQPNRADKFR